MCDHRDVIEERTRIPGHRGELAGILAYPAGATAAPRFGCLLVNPHPHMGGTMSNKLVSELAVGLAENAALTLRFDYAGVGESAGAAAGIDLAESMRAFWSSGSAPEDPLMVRDAADALEYLRGLDAGLPIALVGYSFGAYVIGQIAPPDAAAAVVIAPTLRQHDFSMLRHRSFPLLLAHSDDDFATPLQTTRDWFDALAEPKQAHCVAGGQHFFRGREREIMLRCREFILQAIESEVRA